MKTLKTLQAESIIKECDSILLKLLCDISDLKKATVNGKIRPCKAKKIYKILANIWYFLNAKHVNRSGGLK